MSNDITIQNIKEIISAYKSDFQKVNSEERYKWEAVLCYMIRSVQDLKSM